MAEPVSGKNLPLILRGLRALFQGFAVPDPAFAGIAGEFEILREFEGVNGASVFAEAAEHAAAQVVGEVGEFLAAGVLVAGAGNHNQILRTRQRAQVAGNAHGLVRVGVNVQARRSAVALGHLRPLQRILLGIDLLGILVPERDLQSLQQINEEDFAQKTRHAHDAASIPLNRRIAQTCAQPSPASNPSADDLPFPTSKLTARTWIVDRKGRSGWELFEGFVRTNKQRGCYEGLFH
jgi:hypothetical protein